MKFTLAWCLFAYPDNVNISLANAHCADVCSGPDNTMKPALVNQLLVTNLNDQYLYCADEGGAFSKTTDGCKQCLRNVPNSEVLTRCTSTGLTHEYFNLWLTNNFSSQCLECGL